jgi:hypothetical protein
MQFLMILNQSMTNLNVLSLHHLQFTPWHVLPITLNKTLKQESKLPYTSERHINGCMFDEAVYAEPDLSHGLKKQPDFIIVPQDSHHPSSLIPENM